ELQCIAVAISVEIQRGIRGSAHDGVQTELQVPSVAEPVREVGLGRRIAGHVEAGGCVWTLGTGTAAADHPQNARIRDMHDARRYDTLGALADLIVVAVVIRGAVLLARRPHPV